MTDYYKIKDKALKKNKIAGYLKIEKKTIKKIELLVTLKQKKDKKCK